ncbi:MAG: ATP-binding protein [Terriglobales bacterium]
MDWRSGPWRSARWRRIIGFGALFTLLGVALFYPQSVGMGWARVDVASAWLLFLLSTLSFLAIIALGFVLLRQLLKLYTERRANVLGSKFKTKMLAGALGLSLIPVVCMFAFAYGLINRTLNQWFSLPVEVVQQDTARMSQLLRQQLQQQASRTAAALARQPRLLTAWRQGRRGYLRAALAAAAGPEGFAAATDFQGGIVAAAGLPAGLTQLPAPAPGKHQEPRLAGYQTSAAATPYGWILAGRRLPAPLAARLDKLARDDTTYAQLGRQRRALKRLYTEYLVLLTLAILFAATWFALFLSKLVTTPIQALSQATGEIARGNLGHRIRVPAKDEIATLVASFNRMAGDLEAGRRELEISGERVRAANAELEARRRYTETLLESIPSAVLSLDSRHAIARINPAVIRLFGERARAARRLDDLLEGESRREMHRLLRKAERLGTIASQIELAGPGDAAISAAVTVSFVGGGALRPSGGGFVVVFEDLTDVLRMQQIAAWREVARRIAHEIKNPLTPIALSAERIRRRLERDPDGAPRPADTMEVIASCARTIQAEVRSLESLVGEFSAFARFPAAKPVACDLNVVLERALQAFDGRLDGVRLRSELRPLPLLWLDPDELRRVFVNLIDNAAEAVRGGSVREIVVGTECGDGFVEAYVADSGQGIPAAVKERLFLPYVTTKPRGTGLGLAIVSRIVADHGGTIRVEENQPVGTRFVIEFTPPAANGG